MKPFKESMIGLIAILYGHVAMAMGLMIWTIFLPVLWNLSTWIHTMIAVLVPFVLYGLLGYLIARYAKTLFRIKVSSLIYLGLLWIGLGVAIYLESTGNTQALGIYTLVNYPIAAFYRNAPEYGLNTGIAFALSCLMASIGLIEGFALQRRIARWRGEKR